MKWSFYGDTAAIECAVDLFLIICPIFCTKTRRTMSISLRVVNHFVYNVTLAVRMNVLIREMGVS